MVKIKVTDFYDEFRPYNEKEAKEALGRLAQNERFFKILNYFFNDLTKKSFFELLNSINSIHDFQEKIMAEVGKIILKKTSEGLTLSGIENIEKDKSYVFISNHRDIVLDAYFFLFKLLENGFDPSEVTFGNNLMKDPLVYDLGKINKMFKVYRKGTPKELLKKTIQLSEYIRFTVLTKKRSVWLAQRGGRTKDGNDKTQNGIIKMLNASGTECLVDNLKNLNIIPLTVSYEYEPNDHFKVKELLHTVNGKYEKAENEDIQSIIDGVQKQKGKIHIHIGESINTRLEDVKKTSGRNHQIAEIANIIDRSIHKNYRLHPNNYIAYDLLYDTEKFSKHYSLDQKRSFFEYMSRQLSKAGEVSEEVETLFLQIYSNPVLNRLSLDD